MGLSKGQRFAPIGNSFLDDKNEEFLYGLCEEFERWAARDHGDLSKPAAGGVFQLPFLPLLPCDSTGPRRRPHTYDFATHEHEELLAKAVPMIAHAAPKHCRVSTTVAASVPAGTQDLRPAAQHQAQPSTLPLGPSKPDAGSRVHILSLSDFVADPSLTSAGLPWLCHVGGGSPSVRGFLAAGRRPATPFAPVSAAAPRPDAVPTGGQSAARLELRERGNALLEQLSKCPQRVPSLANPPAAAVTPADLASTVNNPLVNLREAGHRVLREYSKAGSW